MFTARNYQRCPASATVFITVPAEPAAILQFPLQTVSASWRAGSDSIPCAAENAMSDDVITSCDEVNAFTALCALAAV
jgi:hypothetical protein